MKRKAQEVIARCLQLAELSEEPGRITRTFLSPPMRRVHTMLSGWAASAGADSWVDAAGNWRARRQGSSDTTLLCGSHVDTVPDAGAFDGILGVMAGLALLEILDSPKCSLEVVAFSEEEGVRFGVPFIGSRALAGTLDHQLLSVCDRNQVSVADAIRSFGLDPLQVPDARLGANVKGFLEVHIEQGPVLESLQLPLAAVEAIAGQSRLAVTFTGQPNHAGTTPMHLRRDALAGAAEWCSCVERVAIQTPGLVATVGRMSVLPGAGNVVPGSAELSLDVRHADDAVRVDAVSRLVAMAQAIAAQRQLRVEYRVLLEQAAVPCDPQLAAVLDRAIAESGYSQCRLVSGAGHDAMILAPLVPTAMLFVRSPGGISHHPDESVLTQDVEAALNTAKRFIELWEEEVI